MGVSLTNEKYIFYVFFGDGQVVISQIEENIEYLVIQLLHAYG